jgi:DNA-binding MarR family transcriptional regulator
MLDEFEAVIHRFARLMGSQADKLDDRLSPPQFMALRHLEHAGPMRVSELAAQLGVKSPAASMMLNHLFEDHLVDRDEDPDDRRATLVSVSEEGRRELRAAEKKRRVFMRSMTGRLSDEEIDAIVTGLNKLADAATEQLGSTPTPAAVGDPDKT